MRMPFELRRGRMRGPRVSCPDGARGRISFGNLRELRALVNT